MIEDYLTYNETTGHLTWINRPALCIKVGTQAKSLDTKGYVTVCVKGKQYKGHRVAWYLYYGSWPTGVIDHINRDKSDNRIENLRDVTPSVNNLNRDLGASGEHYITKYNDQWRVRKPRGGVFCTVDTLNEAKVLKRAFYKEKI